MMVDYKMDEKFDFNDILIVPEVTTEIKSRYTDIVLPKYLPLFTAPMDTVVDLDNLKIFLSNKIRVTLPRTISYHDFNKKINLNKETLNNVFVSFGFKDLDYLINNNFKDIRLNSSILIDVANGHMNKIIDYAKKIKSIRPDIIIMAGNIGNPETYIKYWESGCVDYVRVGIGNGNGCLTTKHCGVGYPMGSLIYEINLIKSEIEKDFSNSKTNLQKKLPYVVADGGMKCYSDIIKALGLGADYVMVGSLFNKSIESAGDNYLWNVKINKKLSYRLFDMGFPIKKLYRGMSTKEVQKKLGAEQIKTSEGVVRFRKVEYSISDWVDNFEHYLRSAMSYSNATTLNNFIGKIKFCKITKNSYERFDK